jgi:hypothetical protein
MLSYEIKSFTQVISFHLRIFLASVMLAANCITSGQIIRDTFVVNFIRYGISNIYNSRFEEAKRIKDSLAVLYPDHPVNNLYEGMMTYWKNFPILPSSPARNSFEAEMNKCIELTDNYMNPDPVKEAEYLLMNLCARGLLLTFCADNNISGEVTALVRQTYRPLMNSFRSTAYSTDLLYFTGLYNYYREAYVKIHPIYKVVAFIFPPGNMKLGIEELEKCSEESMVMQAESLFILAWIRMHFENDWLKSFPLCEKLISRYPDNTLYRSMYIKNLLLLKKYQEAEDYITNASCTTIDPFYDALLHVFNGLIQEKKYNNYSQAKQQFLTAIAALSAYEPYGNGFAAFAYFGLSRIAARENDKQSRRYYHRKGMDLTDFKSLTFDD